jgi:FlaG/FlaF family flagellin (archaellin)
MTDVAYGEAPDPDDPWARAAAELGPEKSLVRAGEKARFTVSLVSLVATILTAFGFLTLGNIRTQPARGLAMAAVALAVLALLVAMVYLLPRLQRVAIGNLQAVEDYFKRELAFTRVVSFASVLLLIALVLAATAAAFALASGPPTTPQASISISNGSSDTTVKGSLHVQGLPAFARVVVSMTASTGGASRPIYWQVATTDASGTVAVDAEVDGLPGVQSVTMVADLPGRPDVTISLPAQ